MMSYDKSTSYVDEIKARLEAATPGPWKIYDNGFDVYMAAGVRNALPGERSTFDCGIIKEKSIYGGEPCEGAFDPTDPDHELIANAPTDISHLLAEREALREALEKIKDDVSRTVDLSCDFGDNTAISTIIYNRNLQNIGKALSFDPTRKSGWK